MPHGKWILLVASFVIGAMPRLHAQDATWLAAPASGDFNTAANWSPASIPTGTALFGASNVTNIALSADTTVSGWTFKPGASAYTITNPTLNSLTFNGAGIAVSGGSVNLVNNIGGLLFFYGGSSAGSATVSNSGSINMLGASTGGTANVTNDNSMFLSSRPAPTGRRSSTMPTLDSAAVAPPQTQPSPTTTTSAFSRPAVPQMPQSPTTTCSDFQATALPRTPPSRPACPGRPSAMLMPAAARPASS
jgi:hypothetical protein